jgi:hypothetical protein
MILNADFRFENASANVKRAFLRPPEKLLLAARKKLYRWTDNPLIDDEREISPWWSFVETTQLPRGAIADGFWVSEERAKRIGRTHREFARSRVAISKEFNNRLTNLLLIELCESVWGFAGQASGQPEFARNQPELANVFLIGGAYQVWVPNLTQRYAKSIKVRG